MIRRLARLLLEFLILLGLATLAVVFALRITPQQTVSVLGQTVEVGTTGPTLSLSGPGVLDLFGESLTTVARFPGLVRPRLVLTKITVNAEVANFVTAPRRQASEMAIGTALASGWKRYFYWQLAFVAVGALILALAYAGIRRRSRRPLPVTILVVVAFALGIDLGMAMLSAHRVEQVLANVHSLSALVGQVQQSPLPAARGPAIHGIQAVVIGDSTAAGNGNPLVINPTRLDKACDRSRDAYAGQLATANSWHVENLACSGATVSAGILGPQRLGNGVTAPAQLAEAKRVAGLKAIFLSVGADDLDWSAIVRICAAAKTCDDSASTAFFQKRLFQFTKDYYQLLAQLSVVPGHPKIVVNDYYQPFDPKATCLFRYGLNAAKQDVLIGRLAALNGVLQDGAKAFGFTSVLPNFSGHQICSARPFVQGPSDKAPFHPTVSGELAIALADEAAFR
jgi:lysophospholipase L1-like esterase